MAKKKDSKKVSAKSAKQSAAKKSGKKSAAKKPRKRALKEPRGPQTGGYKVWKKIPGTFTYTNIEPQYKWKLVGKAKRAMTQYELDESWAAHKVFHPFFADHGATIEFEAVENPTQAIAAIIRKPTPEFSAMWKAFFTKHIPERARGNKFPALAGSCPQCHGKGWVCEDHEFIPWEVKCGNECPCGAPEMACRTCNPKSTIVLGPGDFVIGPFGIAFSTLENN